MPELLSPFVHEIKIAAAVVGVLLGTVIGRLLAPLLSERRLVRLPTVFGCAAVGGALLWFAFGHLGAGEGTGGGDGSNGGAGNLADVPGPRESKPQPGARTAPTLPANVNVRMLGGANVKNDRIYVLDWTPEGAAGQPCTWDELTDALNNRLKQDRELHGIQIYILPDSVDPDNPAVHELMDWAKQHKLEPQVVFPGARSKVRGPKSKVQGPKSKEIDFLGYAARALTCPHRGDRRV